MTSVGVYDNNFPLRALAVTVDTKANSFVYTSAVNPNSPSYTWSTAIKSAIALVELDDVLAQQPCPVCRGKDQGTMLAFSALQSVNAEAMVIALLDPKGEPLASDLYRTLDTLNPPTEAQRSQDLIIVDPGVGFFVAIKAGQLAASQPMEVYALSNGASSYLLLDELPSNGTILFGVGEKDAIFQSSKASSPRIQQLYDGRTTIFDVNGHPLLLPKEVRCNPGLEPGHQAGAVQQQREADPLLERPGDRLPRERRSGLSRPGRPVPAAAEILVDYSRASATTAPRAWVVAKDGSRTPVRMQRLTESLIEQYRDKLYAVQGPS